MAKKDRTILRSGTAAKGKAQRKPKATALYPKYSLVEALKLAESIRDNNAGQPYNRVDLAASLETSPESSSFRILITASSKYGLTEGGYQAERISLTEIGRSIVSPTSDEERAAGLLRALYNVEFYKSFFSKYQNHRLPRKDLLLNTLEREFIIPTVDREQCYDLLIKNATELGLLKDVGGTPYVRFDQPSLNAADKESDASDSDQSSSTREDNATQGITSPVVAPPGPDQVVQPPTDAATTHKPRIFISHSKNSKILGQIKSNLEFGGFSYKIAIETETTAIPIPEKIFGMMRECNCAIVNVSADETEKRDDGVVRNQCERARRNWRSVPGIQPARDLAGRQAVGVAVQSPGSVSLRVSGRRARQWGSHPAAKGTLAVPSTCRLRGMDLRNVVGGGLLTNALQRTVRSAAHR